MIFVATTNGRTQFFFIPFPHLVLLLTVGSGIWDGQKSGFRNRDKISRIRNTDKKCWHSHGLTWICMPNSPPLANPAAKNLNYNWKEKSVFRIRIRIHRIHMFLVFGPPGSGSTTQRYRYIISKKNLDSYCFVTSFGLLSLKNDVNDPSKNNKQKNFIKKN